MIKKLLSTLNPVTWLNAVDAWGARMDYQGRHWATA